MARTYISWSCGHDEVRQLYGPNKDRDRYVEWAEESGLCPDCYREMKQEEAEQARAARRANLPEGAANGESLPIICTGTEKQNAYAEDIRASYWDRLGELLKPAQRQARGITDEQREMPFAAFLRSMAAEKGLQANERGESIPLAVLSIRDHRFWIDVARAQVTDPGSLLRDPRTVAYLEDAEGTDVCAGCGDLAYPTQDREEVGECSR